MSCVLSKYGIAVSLCIVIIEKSIVPNVDSSKSMRINCTTLRNGPIFKEFTIVDIKIRFTWKKDSPTTLCQSIYKWGLLKNYVGKEHCQYKATLNCCATLNCSWLLKHWLFKGYICFINEEIIGEGFRLIIFESALIKYYFIICIKDFDCWCTLWLLCKESLVFNKLDILKWSYLWL